MPPVDPVGLWRVPSLTRGARLNPNKGKYNLEYYINLTRYLTDMGVQSLDVKDMTGLLNTCSGTMMVSFFREDITDMPLHIHTHNTVETGVSSMIADANAGANIVCAANDAMSDITS